MKIMYVAPRFHTNQSAIVKGWIEQGDEVLFISYYTAIIEDYSCIKPVVLGFSPIYKLIDKIYVDIIHRKNLEAITFKINHGFPPLLKLRKIIKEWKPDVIIMRDRTLYTIATYLMGKRSSCILYNQNPLWDEPPKKDLAHKIVRRFTPQYRMTPVMGEQRANRVIAPNSYFVPFVVEPQIVPEEKKYFQNNQINILCIGKFEPRKHHKMLMDVVDRVRKKTGIECKVTIIGEATTRHQKQFLEEVESHISEQHYGEFVTLLTNVPRKAIDSYYEKTDIFVIPSTREMASISQLEAMSFSVPVICSDTNGTACYVENGKTGYLFRDCDENDLLQKVMMMVTDRDKIVQMGKSAFESINTSYSFKKYYEGIQTILEDMKKDKQ